MSRDDTSVARDSSHLGAETTLPPGIITKGAEEVDLAKIRPQRLAEIEFAVRALPHEKAG